ncbi:barstar family protein [Acrocarpospora phusangensis]|uniref:barstar family protein n=1 Tax=Acrocarpospora phusangensis TaxID=1070424 RepID=UPI001950D04B|nr:barstar family protein [Acrocarpospora phusangensis]
MDYRLMADSPVTLFWRHSILDETTDWLLAHDYQVVRLAASDWLVETDMHQAFAAALDFPEYYAGVLAALNDCLSDVAFCDYGARPEATGLVLVMTGYDTFAERFPLVAEAVLDIIASNATTALLVGHRILCLVQSDNPRIAFGPLGAEYARWNDAEWLEDRRDLG